MEKRRVKFDGPPYTKFEELSQEDRDAILSVLKEFAQGTVTGSPVPDHPTEIGLGAARNWAINLVERDGVFFVIDLSNEP